MVGLSRQTACVVDLVRKPRCCCQQLRIKARILLTQCSTAFNDDCLSFLNQTFKDWESFATRHKTNDSRIYFLCIKSGIMKYDVHLVSLNRQFEPHKALHYTTSSNIQKFYVLPGEWVPMFLMMSATNSHFFLGCIMLLDFIMMTYFVLRSTSCIFKYFLGKFFLSPGLYHGSGIWAPGFHSWG